MAAMRYISFKVLGTSPDKIPNMLEISWIMALLFSRTSRSTQSTFLPVLLIDRHPKHEASSTEVTPLSIQLRKPLKNLCSSCCQFSKNYFQHFESFYSISLQSKQNLMEVTVLSSLPSYRYSKIVNGTTNLVLNNT